MIYEADQLEVEILGPYVHGLSIIRVRKRASHRKHRVTYPGCRSTMPFHHKELVDGQNGCRAVLCKVPADTGIQISECTKEMPRLVCYKLDASKQQVDE